ncbi:hypothetical protein [Staphylococcus simulans]|uniref:hypothetical protein n=1 Tax=Staphylococcus simulans TaxID=1286 RepID=UPI000D1D2AEC|nr:hypothetical protein [Staphylococcus simulans]PTJ14044.1 hypothetical protein BU040_00095 [Staphylococcus simulans]PTJ32888.1 hypothetical protein BU027_10290 [Staphylococcus simulans]PTJ42136.1 hypothetical protein BU022_08595 [Staphylococcus simulans]PTJ76047.1 hypothetical protein BU050_09245 [Staphylococcus simulans]RIN47059.1 hypothetical protein BU036_13245 [Staphylococcus simulans]
MKRTDLGEALAFLMIAGFAIFTFMRGLFWFVESEKVISDSEFYSALDDLMSIWIWGLLLMIVAIILFAAAWLIPRYRLTNTCQFLLIVGGVGASIIYFLMASASIYNAINWLTWAQFAVLTAKSGGMAFIGGMMINGRRQ